MATVKELKAQAKARKIKGFSTMKKAQLEEALAKPPPKPPRTKTKAQQAANPVKQVQPPKKKAAVEPKKKKMKLKTKAELIEDINDDEREEGMSSQEYVDHKNDYRNNYPQVAKTEKQMEKLDDYAYKQINKQIYSHYKANAGKKFPLKNFEAKYVYL